MPTFPTSRFAVDKSILKVEKASDEVHREL
jgi:hypothetical protein